MNNEQLAQQLFDLHGTENFMLLLGHSWNTIRPAYRRDYLWLAGHITKLLATQASVAELEFQIQKWLLALHWHNPMRDSFRIVDQLLVAAEVA